MYMKRILLILALTFLTVFAFLSKYEDRDAMRNLDFAVTVKVQERIDKSAHLRAASFVDTVMTGATFFAGPGFTSFVVLVFTAVTLYDWKKRKFHPKAMIIPAGFILILLIEVFGKSIVHHPSPSFAMVKHPTTMFPANYINEQFSYPSGHAGRAVYLGIVGFVVALINTRFFKEKKWQIALAAGLAGYAVLVGISKIYLGQHWFSDIIGGSFVGAGVGLLVAVCIGAF
jgi:undecaprenyl-diphosphatase